MDPGVRRHGELIEQTGAHADEFILRTLEDARQDEPRLVVENFQGRRGTRPAALHKKGDDRGGYKLIATLLGSQAERRNGKRSKGGMKARRTGKDPPPSGTLPAITAENPAVSGPGLLDRPRHALDVPAPSSFRQLDRIQIKSVGCVEILRPHGRDMFLIGSTGNHRGGRVAAASTNPRCRYGCPAAPRPASRQDRRGTSENVPKTPSYTDHPVIIWTWRRLSQETDRRGRGWDTLG